MARFFWGRKDRKQKMRAAFAPYVTDDGLEEALRQHQDEAHPAEQLVGFLIAHVREEPLALVPSLVPQVFETILDHEGIIAAAVSSCIVATFQQVSEEGSPPAARCLEATHALVGRLGSDVKIAYGTTRGFMLNLGSRRFMSYGPVLPRFADVIEESLTVEFGEAREVLLAAGARVDDED